MKITNKLESDCVNPWIVCAAIKSENCIIAGARHYDKIMHMQLEILKSTGWIIPSRWQQGFIDQFGNFYDRRDALCVVKESGQPFNPERNSGSGDELYSEGLY